MNRRVVILARGQKLNRAQPWRYESRQSCPAGNRREGGENTLARVRKTNYVSTSVERESTQREKIQRKRPSTFPQKAFYGMSSHLASGLPLVGRVPTGRCARGRE